MAVKATYRKYTLQFKFEAGTSRGVLTEKDTWFVNLKDLERPAIKGIGEAGPLKGLSMDDLPDFEDRLREICQTFSDQQFDVIPDDSGFFRQIIPSRFPSILFAFETAIADWRNGGKHLIFPGPFPQGKMDIPVNGLIWMGKEDFMLRQIEEKLAQGYTCLKMKIGAIDFAQECRILASIRDRFSPHQITLRVDANGAFTPEEAPEKLKILSTFGLHSIEQPIRAGQPKEMARICHESPVPVALDEELIGVTRSDHKEALLRQIRPPYIILKPTLLGGFDHCREWIALAEKLGIGWWITSALESNIGLNAISQFTATFSDQQFDVIPDDPGFLRQIIPAHFPSILFAFETALADWQNGGRHLIFPGPFLQGKMHIPINGLIWMGKEDFMLRQIEEKLAQGYTCLKMKIGAIDFAQECRILASIRDRFSPHQITLRVDANGAFTPEEAPEKLKILSTFGLHSIEQPIRAGQPEEMARICRESPVPVALDEELIGVTRADHKKALLRQIRPPYIILKPTLLGGFGHCREWIALAEKLEVGWWITSALESNIGLNAISQFTATFQPAMPQGLGTGQLYHNNIPSPLIIRSGFLRYEGEWRHVND